MCHSMGGGHSPRKMAPCQLFADRRFNARPTCATNRSLECDKHKKSKLQFVITKIIVLVRIIVFFGSQSSLPMILRKSTIKFDAYILAKLMLLLSSSVGRAS